MSANLLLCVFSLFNLIHRTRAPRGPVDPPRTALLTFINNVQYPPTARLNWNPSQPTCSWWGVTCAPDGFTVLYLSLPGMQLTGSIPPDSIGLLTNLRVLSLSDNNLSGPIPFDFSNLTYLTTLYLNNNNFSGNIPSAIATFPYLTRLRLDNNSFSGSLPDMVAQGLTTFNVSYNELVGRIPRSLSMFPISAFSYNEYLCGPPLSTCNASYQQPASDVQQDDKSTWRRAIFGIYSGSTMLILILLSSLGKKMYQHIKPPTKLMERKKLVTFDDDGFDLEDLLKTTTEVLGEGSFGTSYKQVLLEKNKTVVVKILKDVVVTEEKFITTMEVLGKIKNKYVVPLRAFSNYSSDEKLLVYDYMPLGSLSARLHGNIGSHRTQFNWEHRMQTSLSAAKALAYLHVIDEIVHGNITSSNIFLQQETNNEVSLSDYGLNTLFHGSSSLNHRVTGYWAPEVLETHEFTFESDVYSFGVLLLELLTGKIPNRASLDKEGVHFCDWVGIIVCEDQPKVEFFDVEVTRERNIDKMVQLLRIAKDCVLIVPNQRPRIHDVVSMMEDMMSKQLSDYNSKLKGYNDRPSMETRDAPSAITLDTP